MPICVIRSIRLSRLATHNFHIETSSTEIELQSLSRLRVPKECHTYSWLDTYDHPLSIPEPEPNYEKGGSSHRLRTFVRSNRG